jgi:hypothetical protein
MPVLLRERATDSLSLFLSNEWAITRLFWKLLSSQSPNGAFDSVLGTKIAVRAPAYFKGCRNYIAQVKPPEVRWLSERILLGYFSSLFQYFFPCCHLNRSMET